MYGLAADPSGVRVDEGGREAYGVAENLGKGEGCRLAGKPGRESYKLGGGGGDRQGMRMEGGVQLPQGIDTPGVDALPRGDKTPGVATEGN